MDVFLISFFGTAASALVLVPLAKALGWVDQSGAHKLHEGQPALVGGLAIYCGLLVAGCFLPQLPVQGLPFFVGGTLLLAVGALDDLVRLPLAPRFAVQILAGLIMTLWGGVVLRDLGPLFGGNALPLGDWAVPFTLFAVVGVINAVNMIDGLDGLAGGLVLIALSVLTLAAYQSGSTSTAQLLLISVGAVLAFLLFNCRLPGRHRALLFMGDGGSLFLGYAVAWALVELSQGPGHAIAPVTALWILAVPLFDSVGSILRRLLKGQSPFQADRRHIHHALLAAGLSVGLTVTCLWLLAAVLALIGYGSERIGIPDWVRMGVFLALFGLWCWGLHRTWRHLDAQRHAPYPGPQQDQSLPTEP